MSNGNVLSPIYRPMFAGLSGPTTVESSAVSSTFSRVAAAWCPEAYGPSTTIYNRFVRWSRMGVFNRIFEELAGRNPPNRLMIDATHLKAHRTAASLHKKGLFPAALAARKAG